MCGEVVVTDALNLLENFNIIGQEKIIIKFKTPGKEKLRINQFTIYKISKRFLAKERVLSYVLYFTSEESITSLRKKICKSYSGKISEIANGIFFDYLNTGTKKLYIEETINPIDVIVPYWTPIYTMNWLASQATSKENHINYLFYETMNTFYFTSISTLFNVPPVQDFIYSPANINNTNINDIFRSVKNYCIKNSFDTIQNIKSGLFASKQRVVDIKHKYSKDINFNYENSFKPEQHLNKNMIVNHMGDYNNIKYTEDYLSNYYYGFSDNANNINSYGLERISLLYQLQNVSILMEVYGDSELECGHIVNFHLPVATPIYDKKELDRYISGKFIITSIRHDITKDDYNMLLEISKDGLENQLPDYSESV